MDMNNMRNESHVAQKNRRHKLRFQQTTDDPTHHQHVPDNPRYGSICYDPNVFPSEMLNSIASNPHLLLPPNHVYVDQDTGSGSVSGSDRVSGKVVGENSQTVGSWKSVVSSQNQVQVSNDWNVVSYVNSNSRACYGYGQDMESHSLGEQKNPGEVPGFSSSPFYQNTLQDVVTTATIGSNVHQSIPIWMNGSDQVGFTGSRNNGNNCVTQRLSLSLSSVPQPKSEYPNAYSGPKVISDPRQFTGISSFAHRSVGPLGPFTGYATILKNSKYLKPAQELLNDSCDVGGQELVPPCDDTHKILEEELSRVSGESGASSSTIYGSNEHLTGRSSSLSESCRPEFHQKKAKLLYMQEEKVQAISSANANGDIVF
ncbi:TALE protein [Artemisia annua]|uniref:TALE protein n=1 Tax=Artemisia annua TaxID=35608 RepID=A0A2U1PX17_ARTAN|nr:TALE protein [Artemisia annua]